MDNNQKYLEAFVNILEVEAEQAKTLNYRDIETWDSVGHMTLISELEEIFDIMMDTDDIIDLSSFEKGKEILASNYDVEF
ncbi:MAG: acyl carrier protein [Clostridia bacterium]